MEIKDRFKMIMERERLTAGAFAESIGVAQATISHILGSRNKYPSTDVILKLHQRYKMKMKMKMKIKMKIPFRTTLYLLRMQKIRPMMQALIKIARK